MNPEIFQQFGTVRYYPAQKKLTCANGQELTLRAQSLEVLGFLAENPNLVVSKDEIISSIWKTVNVTDDSLVQCISNIRRLLNDDNHNILQTLPKRGYRLLTASSVCPQNTPEKAHLKPVEPLMPTDNPAERPAIAVMRFQNIGVDHTGDVIAAGLATDIHFNLAKMSRLFVVAQASANRLRDLLPDEIGQQLGVSYLVHGATQRSEKQVRATISLVEAKSNKVLWTEQYERPLGNFLQLQDEITIDVVNELDHRIEQHEIKKAFSAPPDNISAWELYHQGLWHCTQTNQASTDEAYRLLKQSLVLDPSFAPTYAAVSATYIHRIFVSAEAGISDFADKAVDYAYQSLEHDDQSGWGYWALGRALHMKKQYTQALDALNLSIKYKPNFSWNHHTKAMVSNSSAGGEEALTSAYQALRLSPIDPNRFAFLSAKTIALIQLKRYEEAAACGLDAAAEPRAYHMTYAVASIALKLDGQTVAAEKNIAEVFKRAPGFCLQNYRNALPHDDETSPDRVLSINTLKKLGVPEDSND